MAFGLNYYNDTLLPEGSSPPETLTLREFLARQEIGRHKLSTLKDYLKQYFLAEKYQSDWKSRYVATALAPSGLPKLAGISTEEL